MIEPLLTLPSWPAWLAIAVLISIAGCVVFARISARGSREKPVSAEPIRKPAAKELIVLVHNYQGSRGTFNSVKKAIEAVRPDAEVIRLEFPAQTFSNANPYSVAAQIEAQIDQLFQAHQYEQIILCGYSTGALLIRKAYVYGCGKAEDAPGADGYHNITRAPKQWTSRVNRFVLLAGMNRGWSRHARHLSLGKRLFIEFGIFIARLSDTCKLIRQMERGEPFVANLRLQWLDVMHGLPSQARPQVIQLLGDSDDFVDPEDSKDVTVSRDFIWVPVNNTRHKNMAQLGESGSSLERKRKIQEAFGDSAAVERLKQNSGILALAEDPAVESVVFVLHGIRDMGDWTSDFEKPLHEAYLAKHPVGKSKLHVHRAQYGYFGMGPFLLWADRQKNVRWFMDQVTELKAQFPNLKEINFIGHSNGTYILASALRKYATLKINRAALAGSVIRRDFPWSKFTGRIGQVRNYVGSADWVVGLCPCVFEKPVFKLFNEDIGSAGFDGFTDGYQQLVESRFVRPLDGTGAHSAALNKKNIPSIVDFIMHGKRTDIDLFDEKEHPILFGLIPLSLLSRMCWVFWIAAVGVVIWGAIKSPDLVSSGIQHFCPHAQFSPATVAWLSRGTYAFVLWLILSTV